MEKETKRKEKRIKRYKHLISPPTPTGAGGFFIRKKNRAGMELFYCGRVTCLLSGGAVRGAAGRLEGLVNISGIEAGQDAHDFVAKRVIATCITKEHTRH